MGRALGAGFRAVAREPWVAVLGMGVTLFRGALALPGTAFVVAVSWLSAREALVRGGGPDAVLGAVLQVWQSPRFRSIAIGLWLAGILLWGALRVAWVAGAVPLVAWRMSGARGEEPRFSQGAAWRFHRVLPVAVVALLLDLAGRAMVLAAALGVLAVGARAQGSASAGATAFVAALALAASAFLASSLSALGDVAVARAAIAGEDGGASRRGGRPLVPGASGRLPGGGARGVAGHRARDRVRPGRAERARKRRPGRPAGRSSSSRRCCWRSRRPCWPPDRNSGASRPWGPSRSPLSPAARPGG